MENPKLRLHLTRHPTNTVGGSQLTLLALEADKATQSTAKKEVLMQERTELKYCSYCKKQTPHKVVDSRTDGRGTGRNLRCTRCGSARIGEIQGFDAALM